MVRPVDVQHIISNIENTERVQQVQQQQLQANSHQFSSEMAKRMEMEHTQVRQPDKPQDDVIGEQKEPQQQYRPSRRKKRSTEPKELKDEGAPPDQGQGDSGPHIVDVVV